MMDSEVALKILFIFLTQTKMFTAELAQHEDVCFWKASFAKFSSEEATQAFCSREPYHLDLKSHIADVAQSFSPIIINKENKPIKKPSTAQILGVGVKNKETRASVLFLQWFSFRTKHYSNVEQTEKLQFWLFIYYFSSLLLASLLV